MWEMRWVLLIPFSVGGQLQLQDFSLFSADIVLAQGLMRDAVTLFVFVSNICMQPVNPDKVRLCPELSGTDRGPHLRVITDRTGTTTSGKTSCTNKR
jgi:hypothetical protein